MHTCIHASMHPCIHASMHPFIHASMHPCIQYIHIHIHIHIHICKCIYMHIRICICIYTYTYTYTYMDVYIYIIWNSMILLNLKGRSCHEGMGSLVDMFNQGNTILQMNKYTDHCVCTGLMPPLRQPNSSSPSSQDSIPDHGASWDTTAKNHWLLQVCST